MLALLGTFLVRSGILESIHAFGASTIGVQFLVFIGLVVALSAGLILLRLPDLRSEARLDSLLSREAFFLLNNLVLVGLCFVIFWGTFFPLISEALTGKEASSDRPGSTAHHAARARARAARGDRAGDGLAAGHAARPCVASSCAPRRWSRPSRWRRCSRSRTPVESVAIADDVHVCRVRTRGRGAGVLARRDGSAGDDARVVAASLLARLIGRNRRRYGGYLVHVGIAVLFLGVAASSAFLEQRDVRLSPGDTIQVGDYRVTYREATAKLGRR